MKKLFFLSVLTLFFLGMVCGIPAAFSETKEGGVRWTSWNHDLFEKAKTENKPVLLNLKAVWCHWCHLMDETTYRDPKVVESLNSKFISVKVDQDANPDLSNRYEKYGWPATVIFSPDGHELMKRRGYIEPEVMAAVLQAYLDDPTPGPSVKSELEIKPAKNAYLLPEQKQKLIREHYDLFDKENAGWRFKFKLIDADQLEYALFKAYEGDQESADMAKRTLNAALNLLDPVWGGFYQYSDEAHWKSPHYEKIMQVQALSIRLYALASVIFNEKRYLEAAQKTADYLRNFLTDKDGAFYTSQDADVSPLIGGKAFYPLQDADRRRLGMPKIDQNLYSRENGWAIEALVSLYHVTADKDLLARALKAARWIKSNRRKSENLFTHGDQDRGGPFLGDSLYMGRAFLALYASTADRAWLKEAAQTADAIDKNFKDEKGGGYSTSRTPIAGAGALLKPVKHFDENVALARFTNLLSHYTGKKKYKMMANFAMRYLASPDLLNSRKFSMGALLADRELAAEPDHVTIVGRKEDPIAEDLYLTGLEYPSAYKRIEWWDRRDGPLANPDVKYPDLPKSAAFVCANKVCSLPAFTSEKLIKQIERNRARVKG